MAKVLKIETKEIQKGVARPNDVVIRLIDNEFRNDELSADCLGVVQSVLWSAQIGQPIRCAVETIMTPAQVEVALADVTLNVQVRPVDLSSFSDTELFDEIARRKLTLLSPLQP